MVHEARKHISSLSDRLQSVRQRITAAAKRSGRLTDEITLIAITKTHSVPVLKSAIELGVTELGENRVQEAEPKIQEIGRAAAHWHLVGHLQSNKARRAAHLFDVIHSLDSVELARRLDRVCDEEAIKTLKVLIQVDLAREAGKSGIQENELQGLAKVVRQCRHLQLCGLMVLPPFFENADDVRPFFRRLRDLRDELHRQEYFGQLDGELSMGMTHDFEIAVEEGATMLRIGTAIFGERERND
jgi:pyridoxal phosphate enzyme (YggS family)